MLQKIVNAMLSLVMYYFPEVEAQRLSRQTRDFIGQVFQVGRSIRCTRTGEVFTVLEVDCGGALITSARTVARVDWVLGCGKLRSSILQQWSALPECKVRPVAFPLAPSL